MKERPILCNDQVARNIRDGRQTQHRVPVKLPDWYQEEYVGKQVCVDSIRREITAPWQTGDLLYVRELVTIGRGAGTTPIMACFPDDREMIIGGEHVMHPDAPEGSINWCLQWKRHPNIHMPKWAARTWVKVKRVWCERVQNISESDAKAEGVEGIVRDASGPVDARLAFRELWESIYPCSWGRNDWVWCCEFERIER